MSGPFDSKTPNLIAENERLRPTRDQILLEPLDFEPSQIIECIRFGRPVRGKVKEVGPGAYQKRYLYRTNEHGFRERCGYQDTMIFQPTEVKPGDIVELGGLNIFDGEGYSFQDVTIEGKLHLLCSEKDVCGVDDA